MIWSIRWQVRLVPYNHLGMLKGKDSRFMQYKRSTQKT